MPTIELSAGHDRLPRHRGRRPRRGSRPRADHGRPPCGTTSSPTCAADHRCVVPTLPLGAHRTPMRPDADLSLTGQAEPAGRADRHASTSYDVTLVANDWGGPLVTAVAAPRADRPAGRSRRARRSTTSRPACPGGSPRWPGGLPGRRLPRRAEPAHRRPLRRLPVTFGWMVVGPHRPRARRRLDRVAPHAAGGAPRPRPRTSAPATTSCLDAIVDDLAALDVPALVAWTTDDRIMPADARAAAGRAAAARPLRRDRRRPHPRASSTSPAALAEPRSATSSGHTRSTRRATRLGRRRRCRA